MALDVQWMQDGTYLARQDRQLIDQLWSEGVLSGLAVSASGAGYGLNTAIGRAIVTGDDQANQGKYLVNVTTSQAVALNPPPGANARFDVIYLQVRDPDAGGAAGDDARVYFVEGATSGGTPVVPAVPNTAIPLAKVLRTAGDGAITGGMITDIRPFSMWTAPILSTLQRDAAGAPTGNPVIFNSTTGHLEQYVAGSWQALRASDVVTATGDLLVASAAGVLGRLGIGATSQVARVSGGTLGYATMALWVGHTWTIANPGVPSGATNFVNPKRIRVPSGMTAKLVRADSAIRAGTSVAFDVKTASTVAGVTAGTNVTGFTSQSAVPAGATVAPTAVALNDGDYIAPVISAVTGSPDNFTVDLLIAYTFAG